MTARGTIAVAALAVLVALLAAVPWLVSDYGLGFMVNLMCYGALTIAWALFSGTTRYVSLGSIIAVALFPLLAWQLNGYGDNPAALICMTMASILIIAKHHENIRRLLSGTEPRFQLRRG